LPKSGFPRFCKAITLCVDLRSRWGLKQSCSPRQGFFNGMLHATCTQGNWVDSWLLVVGSQTTNLIFGFSFGHNLCFKCPNGSCKPILDIYVSISFQWYKELLNAMSFDSCNRSLKIQEFIRTPTPKMGAPLGVWVSILTLSHTSKLPFWPASLQALALVTSPRLRLRQSTTYLEVIPCNHVCHVIVTYEPYTCAPYFWKIWGACIHVHGCVPLKY
jgi:hypothetical protein